MSHVDDWYSGPFFKNRFSHQALYFRNQNSMLTVNPTENVDYIQLCAKSNG